MRKTGCIGVLFSILHQGSQSYTETDGLLDTSDEEMDITRPKHRTIIRAIPKLAPHPRRAPSGSASTKITTEKSASRASVGPPAPTLYAGLKQAAGHKRRREISPGRRSITDDIETSDSDSQASIQMSIEPGRIAQAESKRSASSKTASSSISLDRKRLDSHGHGVKRLKLCNQDVNQALAERSVYLRSMFNHGRRRRDEQE